MSEKKICKMNDEEMKNVVGGQDEHYSSDKYDIPDIDTINYDLPNSVRLSCPACGKDLGAHASTVAGCSMTVVGVCPHCKEPYSITV